MHEYEVSKYSKQKPKEPKEKENSKIIVECFNSLLLLELVVIKRKNM